MSSNPKFPEKYSTGRERQEFFSAMIFVGGAVMVIFLLIAFFFSLLV